jgi:hypothetical protein
MQTPPPSQDLLYPLGLFRAAAGQPLPDAEVLSGELLPEPARTLLVHRGDMTSRLEAHFGAPMGLRVLRCETSPDRYLREVVLLAGPARLPVEYGAIEIRLDAFGDTLRNEIVEAREPLGGLLNRSGFRYWSEPRAFIRLGADSVMRELFGTPEAPCFYGRCNVLLGEGGVELARIVELLRP